MKKSIKYLPLLFVFMFVFISGVSAENLLHTCYYNFSRLAPSGDLEKDAYFKIEIYDSDANPGQAASAKGTPLNNFKWKLGKDPVKNWGSDSNPIDALQYYNSNKECPPYAIYYEHGFFSAQELLLVEYEHIVNADKYIEGWEFFRSNVLLFGLIKEDGDLNVKETCEYGAFDIKYNSNNEVVEIINNVDGIPVYPSINLYLNSPDVELCQPINKCTMVLLNGDYSEEVQFLFYSEYEIAGFSPKQCELMEPKSKKVSSSVCLTFSTLLKGNSAEGIKGMEDYWNKYSECKENNNQACVSEEISNYNSKKASLKSYCNSILNSKNVDDPCVERCLDLNDAIYDLENGDSLANKNDCGFSQNLVIWIANIIRWAKYIVPVIVIILGIIDFIKAIAGDKDDEMKKAQGRFIKRLIAAALIFIIPFIIEFVLNKMGFSSNGCGIINL